MSYNPDIHHRQRRDAINRVSTIEYDYSQAGMYFVTIYCQDNPYHQDQKYITTEKGKEICHQV